MSPESPDNLDPRSVAGWRRFAIPGALFAFAVIVRSLSYTSVFLPTGVQYVGHDAYYHMRRIVYSIANFPAMLEFDAYMNFPTGARPIWSPVFDWSIAALLFPLRERLSTDSLERVIVFLPPLLGATTVVILYYLARRYFGQVVAILASVSLALLSGHVWYSQIGFVDHHAAVAPIVTLLLAVGMDFFRRSGDPARLAASANTGVSVGLGLVLGATLLVWPGTLLHVGLFEIALLIRLLGCVDRQHAVAVTRMTAVIHATAGCLLAPLSLGRPWAQWSPFSPVVLSSFQPWYFAAATVFSLVCLFCWTGRRRMGETKIRRAVSALMVAGAILLASGLLWPSILGGLADGWQWFTRDESFQKLVGESAPLFLLEGRFTTQIALMRLSGFIFLAPIALIGVAIGARRRADRADRAAIAFFLWWTVGLLAATLAQKRFFNSSAVPLALLFAISVSWLYQWMRKRPRLASLPSRYSVGLVACAAIGLMIPTLRPIEFQLAAIRETLLGDRRPTRTPDALRQIETIRLARWIRESTPETHGWDSADQIPEYGVLAPWEIGHVIEYVARRPTVTNNFGDDIGHENFNLAEQYFLGDERQAIEILDRLNVRYVVASSNTRFLSQRPSANSILASLHQFDGSEFRVAGNGTRDWVAALERHRLVYEWMPGTTSVQHQFRFKLFEFVKGANLIGRAAPDAEIHLILGLETNQKRKFLYSARATTSSEGVYRFRVPYANAGDPSDPRLPTSRGGSGVRASNHYTLLCNGERRSLRVSERAVTNGEELRAPELCVGKAAESAGPKSPLFSGRFAQID